MSILITVNNVKHSNGHPPDDNSLLLTDVIISAYPEVGKVLGVVLRLLVHKERHRQVLWFH